jgi:hypothetical protein
MKNRGALWGAHILNGKSLAKAKDFLRESQEPCLSLSPRMKYQRCCKLQSSWMAIGVGPHLRLDKLGRYHDKSLDLDPVGGIGGLCCVVCIWLSADFYRAPSRLLEQR